MWVTVIKSLPEDRASSIISGVMAPTPLHTDQREYCCSPPFQTTFAEGSTENTAALLAVQDLMAPSINPLPELVDNRISC